MIYKKILLPLLSLLIATLGFAQIFEGKIEYHNTYKSKTDKVTDAQFTSMMGTKFEYLIKGGDYKLMINGTYLQGQTYINSLNKLYNRVGGSDTLYWNDGSIENEVILSTKVNKKAAVILGYECDELIFECKSGIYKFYYNSKFGVDIAAYEKHKYGNWYAYLKIAGALPLKYVLDLPQLYNESTAVDIKPMKLNESDFTLPEGVPTAVSPF